MFAKHKVFEEARLEDGTGGAFADRSMTARSLRPVLGEDDLALGSDFFVAGEVLLGLDSRPRSSGGDFGTRFTTARSLGPAPGEDDLDLGSFLFVEGEPQVYAQYANMIKGT